MNRREITFGHRFTSVVVNHLHIKCVTITPHKTDTPLITSRGLSRKQIVLGDSGQE
jgi:hypothetical protein